MNSLPAVHDPAEAAPTSSATRGAPVAIEELHVAANHDATAPPDAVDNPLWIIVVAMAIFFGTVALATALT